MTRTDEIRAGLDEVRARIDSACRRAGRTDAVRLVVVTKTFPASDVRILAELGVREVGENRDQEARAKRAELGAEGAEGAEGTAVRWHMIGQLQRNKARSVATWADVVESIDRLEVASALAQGAQAAGREVEVLLQVSLDEVPAAGRGGVPPDEAVSLGEAIADLPGLRVAGVMGVAPHPGDPAIAFARLATVAARVQRAIPGATTISAGMSGDLEQAIAHGATQVRIGGAVLGNRPPLR